MATSPDSTPVPAPGPGQLEPKGPTNLEDLAKFAAFGSAAVYGAQFLIYSSYYASIGVGLEEVGISNTYLLPRAVGFALLLGTLFLCILGGALVCRGLKEGSLGPAGWLRVATTTAIGVLLGIFLAVEVVPEGAGWLAPIFLLVVPLLTIGLIVGFARYPPGHQRNIVVMTVALTVAVPVTMSVAIKAADAAACVRMGTAVEAVQLAGIPLVDVAARKVTVLWIGDSGQKPAPLFGAGEDPAPVKGLLIGQNSDAIIVRIAPGGEIARIPADQVTTTVVLGDPAAQPADCTP